MAYKALITIDLPGINKDQRDTVYSTLKDLQWNKLDYPDTSWTASFKENVEYGNAIRF